MADDDRTPEPDGITTFSKAQLEAAVTTAATAAVERAVTGLKTKNAELLTELDPLKELKHTVGDLSLDDLGAALKLAGETRDKNLRASGDFDTLKADLERANTARADAETVKLTGMTESRDEVLGELYHALGLQQVTEHLAALDGNATVMSPHITPYVKIVRNEGVNEPGKRYRATVVDAAGNPRFGADASPMTIKALVEEFRDNEVYGANFGAGDATGSDARTGHRNQVKPHTITKSAATDPATGVKVYRAALAAAEKAGVPLEITDG